jgi:dethiobiotin synthetase
MTRGLFVSGTDTEVGKTVLAAAICAALVERGDRVAAFKPAVTGLDDDPGEWGHDHELLASVANCGQSSDDVAPYRFDPPLSPHLAAERAGVEIDTDRLVSAAQEAGAEADVLVVEGVGGLMVPLTPGYLVRNLAVELELPLVIAARTGLGTINHSLLTIEAAWTAELDVGGVVLTPWPDEPAPIELSNGETIERLGEVVVGALPKTTPDGLSAAGAALPLDDWLEGRLGGKQGA